MDRSEKSAKMVFTPPGATLCCSLHECVTIKTHHLGARHFMLNWNFMEKHASSSTLSSDNAHFMPSCQANNATCSCSGVTSFNALIQRYVKEFMCFYLSGPSCERWWWKSCSTESSQCGAWHILITWNLKPTKQDTFIDTTRLRHLTT